MCIRTTPLRSSSFLRFPFLEGSTPSPSYMICRDLVQCVSSPLGKPLFVLKQLFASSLSGSFLSARPPTHGGEGCRDRMGYRGELGRAAWWVPLAGSVAPSRSATCGWVLPQSCMAMGVFASPKSVCIQRQTSYHPYRFSLVVAQSVWEEEEASAEKEENGDNVCCPLCAHHLGYISKCDPGQRTCVHPVCHYIVVL